MSKEKIFIIAAFAMVLAVVLLVPYLPLANGVDPDADWTGDHVPAYRGIWLELHNDDPGCPYETYVEEIINTKADTLCLSFAAHQENAVSKTIYVGRGNAPSKERLAKLIGKGRDAGMKIVLMPKVLLDKPKRGEWRGEIRHEKWNSWWVDYSNFIVEYAEFAQRHGVDIYMIGTELTGLEEQQALWRKLIGMVRARTGQVLDELFGRHMRDKYAGLDPDQWDSRFGIVDSGTFAYSQIDQPRRPALVAEYALFTTRCKPLLLSYSANWDHYTVPKWWDAVDVVGMTTYHNINKGEDPDPTLEQLLEAWKPIRKKIAIWQRRIGKPIFFTEVGWASQDGCSVEPWNYYRSETVNLTEQQRCMESFLETFGHLPWVEGILIWKWRDHPGISNGSMDPGYSAYDKPVLKVIEAYFERAVPESAPGTAPAE